MSLTGLFLCTILLIHLFCNLQLFKNDEGKAFEAYSEFMSTNFIIRTIEIGLFLFLLIHAINGVYLWFINKFARTQKYAVYKLKENTELAARTMIITALLIFIFLVIHLNHYFVPSRLLNETESLYNLVIQSFADPTYVVIYLIAFIVLGYHLKHGFQSAFQTLGLRTKRYILILEWLAVIFWLLVPLGYAIIPIYFYWLQRF